MAGFIVITLVLAAFTFTVYAYLSAICGIDRLRSEAKIKFTNSPLGLLVEHKDEYDKAHSLYAVTQGGAVILWFGSNARNIKTVNRIAAYRAKRDKLDGVL